MPTAIVYVDGFNLYYGLRTWGKKQFYWLDTVKFFDRFMRTGQALAQVKYFSASSTTPDKRNRQDLFFSANKLNPRFELILGRYVVKNKTCFGCGHTIRSWEEKRTDVHLALHVLMDAISDKCDISIIVSADSDIEPAIEAIHEHKPNQKIFVYFPPHRYAAGLKGLANGTIKLQNYQARFNQSQLPDQITLPSGYVISRPATWV